MASNGFGPVPASPAQQTADAATLAGDKGDSTSGGAEDQARSRAFTSQIRELHTSLNNLARQYPGVADAAEKCKNLLTDAMVKQLAVEGQNNPGPRTPVIPG